MRRLVAGAMSGVLAIAPIAPAYAQPKTLSPSFPPYEGAYEPQDLDERGLWQEMDEAERQIAQSKVVLKDPALQGYLEEVLCNAVGSDRCSAARIYIVRESSFNASMAPNGMMLVHTGLLMRMRNEAELASVLGHEFGHFEKRHTLRLFKKAKTGSDIAMFAMVLTGINASGFMYANLFDFNRDQETDADLVSSSYLVASPYPSRAAADVWVRLIDEDDARAVERKRRRRNRHTSWFDSHPAPLKRAEYLARAAEAAADEGDYGADRFAGKMEPYILGFYEDQLQRNDFAASKFILDQMAGDYWRPVHWVMQGELYRKRGNPRDLVTAEESFRHAIADGTERPEAWRGLGLTLMRTGDRAGGAEALAAYLEMAPDAPDAAMMKMMIKGS